jgi:hypothetical protein
MKVGDTVAANVPANDTVQNVFQGRRFERAPTSGFLSLYCTGSAAGLELELNIGGRSITARQPINAQNRIPVVPDDFLIGEVEAYQGELIQVTVGNTTGGALTARVRMELEEAQEVAFA